MSQIASAETSASRRAGLAKMRETFEKMWRVLEKLDANEDVHCSIDAETEGELREALASAQSTQTQWY